MFTFFGVFKICILLVCSTNCPRSSKLESECKKNCERDDEGKKEREQVRERKIMKYCSLCCKKKNNNTRQRNVRKRLYMNFFFNGHPPCKIIFASLLQIKYHCL